MYSVEKRALGGFKDVSMDDINAIREKLKVLKSQYLQLVGSNDVPLYFGRLPDQLQ